MNPEHPPPEDPNQLYGVAGAGSVSVHRGGVDRQARILVFCGEIERPETDHKPAGRGI